MPVRTSLSRSAGASYDVDKFIQALVRVPLREPGKLRAYLDVVVAAGHHDPVSAGLDGRDVPGCRENPDSACFKEAVERGWNGTKPGREFGEQVIDLRFCRGR